MVFYIDTEAKVRDTDSSILSQLPKGGIPPGRITDLRGSTYIPPYDLPPLKKG